jgi:aldose 1-epimerase
MLSMNAPITGDQYTIAAGPYAAAVTELGGGLRELSCDGRALILSYDADELAPAASGQLLMPWPNRIDHGRYDFGGESHALPIDEAERDTAIHGIVRWEPWQVAEHEPHRLRLTHRLLGRQGYPFRLDHGVEYSLDASGGLTVRMSVTNTGSRPAPYGHGAHPYLTLGRPIDECELFAPAGRYLRVDDRAIPVGAPQDVAGTEHDFGEPRRLGRTVLDNPYTALPRDSGGLAWVRLSDGEHSVALWADEAHPWLELYTLDEVGEDLRRTGLGAEPMTCPPNAFVTGTDLVVLEPGQTFTGTWGISAG